MKTSIRIALMATLCAPLAAQRASVLLDIGSPLPDGSTVAALPSGFKTYHLLPGGDWTAMVESSSGDFWLLRNHQPLIRTGDPLPTTPAADFERAWFVHSNPAGDLAYAHELPQPFGAALIRNDSQLLAGGDPFPHAPFGPDTTVATGAGILEHQILALREDGTAVVRVLLRDPGFPDADAIAAIDSQGNVTVLAWSQLPFPSYGGPLSSIAQVTDGANFDLDGAGVPFWSADDAGTGLLLVGDQVVATEGTPTLTPGFDYVEFDQPRRGMALDSSGWASVAFVHDSGQGSDVHAVLRNGEVVYRGGQTLPQSFQNSIYVDARGQLFLTERGDLLWEGGISQGIALHTLWRDEEPIVQLRERVLDGRRITGLFENFSKPWMAEDSGAHVLLYAELSNSGVDFEPTALILAQVPLGETYCLAMDNSTGRSASLQVYGSPVAADNDLILRMTDAPANQFGMFLVSATQGFPPNPTGVTLCLDGDIGRFSSQVQLSDNFGRMEIPVDLTDLPIPTGSTAVMAGETWNFQCWFRDTDPSQPFNFSSAVSVLFE